MSIENNMLEMRKSTLLTTRSNFNGTPLWQHIGQRITDKWQNGKQVIDLTIVINSYDDLRDNSDELYVFNVVRGFDETNQSLVNTNSIIKNFDGTAKKFKVINNEIVYDGSLLQNLSLQEI
jgi:hypothetical protein